MKTLFALIVGLLTMNVALAVENVVPQEAVVIEPKEAAAHVGQRVEVHGFCGDVTEKDGNVYVNFGRPFPNHVFYGFVPKDSVVTVGMDLLRNLQGKKCSVIGTVEVDQGRARIVVTEAGQLR